MNIGVIKKKRDEIKNRFLLNLSYDFLRMDYTLYHTDKIEEKLTNYLKNINYLQKDVYVTDLNLYNVKSMTVLFENNAKLL